MSLRQAQVIDEYQRPVPGSNIYVYDPLGDLASLTIDDAAIVQPLKTDDFGFYSYDTIDGIYREDTFYGGKLRFREVVAVGDAQTNLFDLVRFFAAGAAASAQAAAASAAGTIAGAVALPRLTPEMFGAIGDGVTDDSAALSAMSAALSALGRGVVEFNAGHTYAIGGQTAGGTVPWGPTYRYAPTTAYPVEINACTGPVAVRLNGARIKCLAGKRYGSFDAGGSVYNPTLPFADTTYASTPYAAMIYVHDCTGPVLVENGELDGNIAAQTIGGAFGDVGIQISCSGVVLENNSGGVLVEGVKSHHHGLDGGIGNGPGDPTKDENVRVANSSFLNNGRQGFSLVGGCGWSFDVCRFNGTGKDLGGSMTYSPPGNGVDLEAEGTKWVIRTKFNRCEFADNTGPGLGAVNSTKTEQADFTNCRFVGTTTYSIWPQRPSFRFLDSQIVGAILNPYPSADQSKATQFHRCTFTDDITLSPTATVYTTGAHLFVDSSADNTNILFNECGFYKTKLGSSASMTFANPATLNNCSFNNIALDAGMAVYGTRTGERTTHSASAGNPGGQGGTVDTGAAWDSFVVNGTRYPATIDKATGKRIFTGSATYDPPSLAAAAKTTIQTMTVTGVVLGDKVDEVSFSQNLAGARISAWVSVADTVSYYFVNENGANPLDLASGTLRVKVSQA